MDPPLPFVYSFSRNFFKKALFERKPGLCSVSLISNMDPKEHNRNNRFHHFNRREFGGLD
jgi:hypothetical protein